MEEACRVALSSEPSYTRAEEVSKCSDDGAICETCRASEFSPGIVEDIEILHLLVRDPSHVLDDKKVHPGLLAGVFTRGLSTLREAASNDEFLITAKALIGDEPKADDYLHGVCSFTTRSVRYINDNRLETVFDTAYKDRPYHADVFQPRPASFGNAAKKRRQRELRDIVSVSFTPITVFREGIMSHYKRPDLTETVVG